MDKAKEAVSSFLHKSGHHDTTVHETIAPAVTSETVSPTRHENFTTAVDREVHQDHHHVSVQPIHHKEVLPEQHSHQMAGVQERHYEHDDAKDVERRRMEEAAKYKDTRTVADTEHTQATSPTMSGEHIHHHVHETIQPVVHKETIQPSVVHTTVPIHEVHHNVSQHHSTTALPAVSLDEFKKQGGVLEGRSERHDAFEGEPKALSGFSSSGSTGTHSGVGTTEGHTMSGTSGATTGHTSTGTTDTRGLSDTRGPTDMGSTTGTTGTTSKTGTTSMSDTAGTAGHTSATNTADRASHSATTSNAATTGNTGTASNTGSIGTAGGEGGLKSTGTSGIKGFTSNAAGHVVGTTGTAPGITK